MALATSKRKFYKLLDNLSTSKPHAQPQAPVSDGQVLPNDRPAKRTRMPLSTQSAYADTSRPSSTSIRVLAPGSTTTTTRIGPNNSVEDAPTYAPWSQDQFLGRLETFADVKLWTTKPEPLSDVYWARRGWIAIGLDEVACRTCGKHMLVRIDAGGADDQEQENDEDGDEQAWWQTGVEQDYVDKYEKLIIDGHTQDCLWRKSGCKDDIYRIKFSDPAQWQSELAERYSSLLGTPSSLPSHVANPLETQESKPDRADLKAIIAYFKRSKPTTATVPPATDKEPKNGDVLREVGTNSGVPASVADSDRIRSAAIMAVCGWKARDVAGVHIAGCQKCFARVGLWLYDSTGEISTVTEEDEIMKFDPITLHRTHCPWQSPSSQCGLGSYSGYAAWEIVVELLGLEAGKAERRRSVRIEEIVAGCDDEEGEEEEQEEGLPLSRDSRDETERQDKERETRLERLKRAFTVKNTTKKGPRPLSSRSTKSFLSTRSFHRRDEE